MPWNHTVRGSASKMVPAVMDAADCWSLCVVNWQPRSAVEALLFGSIEGEELVEAPFWNCTGLRAMEFSFSISELHGGTA